LDLYKNSNHIYQLLQGKLVVHLEEVYIKDLFYGKKGIKNNLIKNKQIKNQFQNKYFKKIIGNNCYYI